MSQLFSAGLRTLVIFIPFLIIKIISSLAQQATESFALRFFGGVLVFLVTMYIAIQLNHLANKQDSGNRRSQQN